MGWPLKPLTTDGGGGSRANPITGGPARIDGSGAKPVTITSGSAQDGGSGANTISSGTGGSEH